MTWEKSFINIPQYEFASSNQHGMRYKRVNSKCLSCAKLSADVNNAYDMRQLILLSHHLSVPVHYSFDTPQTAYIEIVSKEAVVT